MVVSLLMWLFSVSKCPVPCAGSAVILRPVGEGALQRTGYSSLVRFIYSAYRLVPSASQPPRPCFASFCVHKNKRKTNLMMSFHIFSCTLSYTVWENLPSLILMKLRAFEMYHCELHIVWSYALNEFGNEQRCIVLSSMYVRNCTSWYRFIMPYFLLLI